MSKTKNEADGESWKRLLRDWNFEYAISAFQHQNFTNIYYWYYLTKSDFSALGLKNEAVVTFKKLCDQWTRKQWTMDSPVQIYSQSRNKWFDGVVVSTLVDEEGEWLTVRYNERTSKQVQRFCEDIRSPQVNGKPPPSVTKSTPKPPRRSRSQSVCIEGTDININVITDLTMNERLKQQQKTIQNQSRTTNRETRESWNKGEYVEVYSRSKIRWLVGKIAEIGNDEEGEYLEVHYHDQETGQNSKKRVGRHDEEIRAYELTQTEAEDEIYDEESGGFYDPAAALLDDDDSDEVKGNRYGNLNEYPESPVALQYRLKELSELRRDVLLQEGRIHELKQHIEEMNNILQIEIIELKDSQNRLEKEEDLFQKQSEAVMRQSRKKWKPGSYMEVYSNSRKQWFLAECTNIFEDNEGEWLEVLFCANEQTIMKQIQRFSLDLRPCESDKIPPITGVSQGHLRKIHELPRREEALHEEWSTYHEQRQQDLDLNTIQEDEEEVDFGAQEIDYSKQSRFRNESRLLTIEEANEIRGGEELYISYQGRMIEITAKLNQPVSQLMQHISVVLHIEPETQKLFFNGEPLKRHESLLNYKISAEDTIVLEVPQPKNTRRRVAHGRAARASTNDVFMDQLNGMSYDNLVTPLVGDPEDDGPEHMRIDGFAQPDQKTVDSGTTLNLHGQSSPV